MTFFAIAAVLLIIGLAWGGMGLMQRTTGCAQPVTTDRQPAQRR